jgi:putative heme iron utilization protein
LSLATASPALDLEAIRAALKEQPDGVLDDVAHRHAVPLRVVLDLPLAPAARSASGARFADIWGDLVDWGPVTFIVHTEDGVFETKAPPPGSEARGYFNNSRRETTRRSPAHCAMRRDLFYRPSILRTPLLFAAVHQHRRRRHVQCLCRAR